MNQQHYSPAKTLAPKPLTSTYLAPPSPSKLPANVALTAETARLQAELLQLALLRRDAPAVDAEWRRGARRALGGRFATLRADDAAVSAAERARAERRCVAALLRWSASSPVSSSHRKGGGAGGGLDPAAIDLDLLDEKVRALDEILDGVWGLGDPDDVEGDEDGAGVRGRYARCVRAFEAWVERAAKVLAAQRRGGDVVSTTRHGGEEDSGAMFLGDLDDGGWQAECAGLTRRLEAWSRALQDLGDVADFEPESEPDPEPDPEPDDEDDADEDDYEEGGETRRGRGQQPPRASGSGSGLARVLRGCRALVDGMLAELDAMARIERDAAAAEDEWVERMGAELRIEEAGRGEADTPGRGLAGGQLAAPLWSAAV